MPTESKRDGFSPSYWGATTWKVLFITALSYPAKSPNYTERQHFSQFYNSLQTVLPCEKCRKGVYKYLHENSIEEALYSRMTLLQWLTKMHNEKSAEDAKIKNLNDLRRLLRGGHDDKDILKVIDELESKYYRLRLG